MPGAAFIVDKAGWILDCNQEAVTQLSMHREAVCKERIFMLSARQAPTQLAISTKVLHKMNLLKVFAELQDDPIPRMLKIPLVTSIGEKTWYTFTISRLVHEKKNCFLILAHRAPDPAADLDAIEASEQQYRHLFDTQPFAMMIFNEKMRVSECNFKMEVLTGYPMGELVGLTFSKLPFLRPGQADMLLEKYSAYLQNNDVEPPVMPITTRDGREIHVEVSGTNVMVGKKMHLQVIAQDVTENVKMQHMMAEENKRLKELDAMRKSFITNASHEIKTPLTSIDGASAFLADKFAELDDASKRGLIDLVRRGSRRLKALLEALLDFSGIENKEVSVKLVPTTLIDVINEAITSVSYLITKRHHHVNLFVDAKIRVLADKAKLEQVLENLLSNAAKNTSPNGHIEVSAVISNNACLISVKDDGVGIEPDEMGKLFQKFGKLERHGYRADIDIQGPGIGLYITREIIALHGGMIWAESPGRGKGATFKFTIPLALAGDHHVPGDGPVPPSSDSSGACSGK